MVAVFLIAACSSWANTTVPYGMFTLFPRRTYSATLRGRSIGEPPPQSLIHKHSSWFGYLPQLW